VVGDLMTDFNTGAFTARLDPEKTINMGHHQTRIGAKVYPDIEMGDILAALAKSITESNSPAKIKTQLLGPVVGSGKDPISAEALYPRWANSLKSNDILITETGTSSMGLGFALLPKGATFHNQTLWGAIGWATPAAFGAAVCTRPTRHLSHRRGLSSTNSAGNQPIWAARTKAYSVCAQQLWLSYRAPSL